MIRKPSEDDYATAALYGVTRQALYARFRNGWEYELAIKHPLRRQSGREQIENDIFSVYIGDEFQIIGTADECAEHMGWALGGKTTRFYTAPSIQARQKARKNGIMVERLIDDED